MAWTRAGFSSLLLFVSLTSSSGFVWLARKILRFFLFSSSVVFSVFAVSLPPRVPCSCSSLSLSISLSLFLPDSSDEGNALPFLDRVPVLTVALHPSARRFASVSPFSRRFRPSSRKRDPVRRFPLLIQRHRGCAITVSP